MTETGNNNEKTYEQKRNSFIPDAERHANRIHGKKCPLNVIPANWRSEWTKCYLDRMQELSVDAGLVAG